MDKQKKIVNMFDDIAKTYDMANRVLSFGVDKTWRKRGCDLTYGFYDKKELSLILDVACGTGDMLDYWRNRAEAKNIQVEKYLGIDPSTGMLEVARKKLPDMEFLQAEAKNLPVEDSSADILSISYGIRNVVDRIEALKEFHRVLKPSGMIVILEFTKQEREGIGSILVDFYMKRVLPAVGGMVSGNKEAYQYLPNSIDNFLTTKKMIDELKESGFEMMYHKSFSMGISTLFIAKKI
ncbi:bifunctional demethylmenaquinone methyltransferase/2-methoxy-6-polyprenyl-1,4-benzoquinol methylase UbiE [Nitrosophilus alvini]|uniref:bifunctional demethylmenaquinone methyltransferase/2-methoxy-6-polyprenyl-1,4-benzoquinol methylase UbiE n=1 Tax=Nitrosophilus alvini TaxID=2714855 RepID=UPI00190AD617|nr:bifunctional demethylmenaquinone methyltransferase/2-methoxy-6-polyprenyl-1,4-benzoquinol methylase UbiE [Nitrosophilus alvini]